ncbi:MAG: (Fe-S)-binding protein [Ignavibacteria bacterium]|nr:(Fe-S)-binding protein [Ignavibacteria bacterium]
MQNNKSSFFQNVDLPSDEVIAQCIHCGSCLQSCPTYNLTYDEKSSPRGRIRLIKAVAQGELEITETFAAEMNFCLDCQACETACPAGVKYGLLVEAARVQIENSKFTPGLNRFIKKFFFRMIIPDYSRLKFIARCLRFYQRSGLQKFVNWIGILNLLSKSISRAEKLSPQISSFFSDEIFQERISPRGKRRFRVLFPTGCLMNIMFSDINKDTIEVLLRTGCEVIIPKMQTCCGSLQAHNGDMEIARKLAKQNFDLFSRYDYDYLISNSAGCGAFMKEYGHILKSDSNYYQSAKKFSDKVLDVMEFLQLHAEFSDIEEMQINATYHEACHLVHTQKISNQPIEVLKKLPGLNLIPLNEATWCCGSAGIYNIVNFDDSMKILERKINNLRVTNAEIILTGNPGCIGQIKYGCKVFGANAEVLHPVTLINRYLSRS